MSNKILIIEKYVQLLILSGYCAWLISLWSSDSLHYYINPRFYIFNLLAILVFFVLAVFQLIRIFYRNRVMTPGNKRLPMAGADELQAELSYCLCASHPGSNSIDPGNDVSYSNTGVYRDLFYKALTYLIFIFPLALGLILPPQGLEAEAMSDRVINQSIDTEQLNDNTGIERPAEEESFLDLFPDGKIIVDDDIYFDTYKVFWREPDIIVGKEIELIGFAYQHPDLEGDQFFIGRYLIFCCAADANIINFLSSIDQSLQPEADTWIQVQGTVDIGYFGDRRMGMVIIESFTVIEEPEVPYVFW
jgi:putative membrane protein